MSNESPYDALSVRLPGALIRVVTMRVENGFRHRKEQPLLSIEFQNYLMAPLFTTKASSTEIAAHNLQCN